MDAKRRKAKKEAERKAEADLRARGRGGDYGRDRDRFGGGRDFGNRDRPVSILNQKSFPLLFTNLYFLFSQCIEGPQEMVGAMIGEVDTETTDDCNPVPGTNLN